MADLDFIPVVALTVIRRLRTIASDHFLATEFEALVWDPTAVRLLLDEKVYRQPVVAVVMPA